MPKTERILVVDDAPDALELVRRVLVGSDYEVFTAPGAVEAIRFLADTPVDLVITDLKMPKVSGLDLVQHIRQNVQDTDVMMITGYPTIENAVTAVKSGAQDYLCKPFTEEELLTAVRRVLAGGIYVSERVGASMIERFAVSGRVQNADPIARLSNRELQVLNLIGRGRTTREIADGLNLSVKTVESHRQRIKKKLTLTTAPQLVQFAVNWYSGRH